MWFKKKRSDKGSIEDPAIAYARRQGGKKTDETTEPTKSTRPVNVAADRSFCWDERVKG